MKNNILIISFLLVFILIGGAALAQDIKNIEHDLVMAFHQIDSAYNKEYRNHDDNDTTDYASLVELANDEFQEKLLDATSKYPETLTYGFPALQEAGVSVATAPDHKFRCYTWDTRTGGSYIMHAAIYQYDHNGIASYAEEGDGYDELDELNTNGQTIYIGFYSGRGMTTLFYQGVSLVEFRNDSIVPAELFKTNKKLLSNINFEYYLPTSNEEGLDGALLKCDDNGKTIRIRVINGKEKVTRNWITYKFDGQYYVPLIRKKNKIKKKG